MLKPLYECKMPSLMQSLFALPSLSSLVSLNSPKVRLFSCLLNDPELIGVSGLVSLSEEAVPCTQLFEDNGYSTKRSTLNRKHHDFVTFVCNKDYKRVYLTKMQ